MAATRPHNQSWSIFSVENVLRRSNPLERKRVALGASVDQVGFGLLLAPEG